MRARVVVDLANEQVSIVTVCRLLGVPLTGDEVRRKVPCPFGQVYHSDGGLSPTMRINVEANTARCFNCEQTFTPVRLYAHALDLSFRVAAARLLDHAGYRPADPAAVWQRTQRFRPAVDKALLADALKTYCRRVCPDWPDRQFDPQVAATLTRCLAILDLVLTAQDVTQWLGACKAVMNTVLNTHVPSVRENGGVLLTDVQADWER